MATSSKRRKRENDGDAEHVKSFSYIGFAAPITLLKVVEDVKSDYFFPSFYWTNGRPSFINNSLDPELRFVNTDTQEVYGTNDGLTYSKLTMKMTRKRLDRLMRNGLPRIFKYDDHLDSKYDLACWLIDDKLNIEPAMYAIRPFDIVYVDPSYIQPIHEILCEYGIEGCEYDDSLPTTDFIFTYFGRDIVLTDTGKDALLRVYEYYENIVQTSLSKSGYLPPVLTDIVSSYVGEDGDGGFTF